MTPARRGQRQNEPQIASLIAVLIGSKRDLGSQRGASRSRIRLGLLPSNASAPARGFLSLLCTRVHLNSKLLQIYSVTVQKPRERGSRHGR